MMKVKNMFRELSMANVTGYTNLPNWQKDLFDETYKKHLSSMSIEKRTFYTENYIKKIEGEKSLVKVFFQNKDCFFYLPGEQWVKVSKDMVKITDYYCHS